MAYIINKSNHPVQVKRIEIRTWSLRDELEAAIENELNELPDGETTPNLEKIKEFYSRAPNLMNKQDLLDLEEEQAEAAKEEDEEDDSEAAMAAAMEGGDEEDDSEAAMAAAMEGGDEKEEEKSEEESEDKSEEDSDNKDEEKPEGDSGNKDEEKADEEKIFVRPLPKEEKLRSGFTLLSDINMEYILLFASGPFTPGQVVAIEFMIPQNFIMTAEVLKCENMIRNSRVISESKPSYRIQCIFTYNQFGERHNLREFLKSIEPEIPVEAKKLKRPAGESEDDDDEFEDLGF